MKEKNEKIDGKQTFSDATVSRVLRHCGNVDADTRRQILFSHEHTEKEPYCACDIYVILPDTPRFFWGKLLHGLSRTKIDPAVCVKYNLYSGIRDEDVVLHYLAEAEALAPKVIILATNMTPGIEEKLKVLQQTSLIFLLSEYAALTNAFYFGSDNYADGYRMGEIFRDRYGDMTPIVLNVERNHNVTRRTEGFAAALGDRTVGTYSIPPEVAADIKLFPSKLAAMLAEWMDEAQTYCLYIPFGSVYLSRVLKKAKCGERLVFLDHDCNVGEDGRTEQGIAASVVQDTFGQGAAAIQAAERYVLTGICPREKCTYIPSVIVEGKE